MRWDYEIVELFKCEAHQGAILGLDLLGGILLQCHLACVG